MLVNLKGQELQLRRLSDEEYNEANDLALMLGSPLSKCPTCGSIPEWSDDPFEEPSQPTYQFRGQEYPCECRAQIALFARYLLARIPEEYMRLDWADYDGDSNAREFVAYYLEKWEGFKKHGFGVEFGGTQMGIGKTFSATHIGKELVKRKQSVYYVPFVEMVAAFEKENGQELERRIRMTPYVILDDIASPVSDRQAQFYHTRFEAIVRHRTNYNLPTIITTNLSAEELSDYYPRTYALLAAKQERVNMTGENVRAGKVRLENMELIANGEVRPIT
jgi:DNA replication protein DnaC